MSRWKRDGAHLGRMLQYGDLPEAPVVWDVGGYEGEWTDTVLAVRPAATVHIFEPHPRFAAALRSKFADASGVSVHPFAVGSAQGTLSLDDTGDASSAFGHTQGSVPAEVRAVSDFWDGAPVDLVKMNIEGGEYDLLPAMRMAGVMAQVRRLQVQFHLYEEPLISARAAIRDGLLQTHDCAWDYPFVWEEWRLR